MVNFVVGALATGSLLGFLQARELSVLSASAIDGVRLDVRDAVGVDLVSTVYDHYVPICINVQNM